MLQAASEFARSMLVFAELCGFSLCKRTTTLSRVCRALNAANRGLHAVCTPSPLSSIF